MEIIPIIYTVLVIVIVLTIFTLSYSYYALRKNQGKVVKTPPKKSVPLQSNSFLNKNENLKPLSIIPPQKAIRVEKKVKSYNEKVPEIKKTKADKTNKSDKKKLIRNSRIEVLNSIQLGQNNSKTKISNDPNLKSLDGNILENYSDEEKNDMFTLKITDKNDKSKNKS